MTKLKMVRAVAAASTSLVLSLGVVGIASAHHMSSGSHGSGVVSSVDNDNDVDVKNDNDQRATTGEAEVKDNKVAGDASTGDASNENGTEIGVDIENTNCGCVTDGVSSLDADDESNSLSVKTTVDNDNDVDINNYSDQKATSGDATVKDNKEGGDASTGAASNTNSTHISVSITN